MSLTTIILTYNEELHIARCIENISKLGSRVVIVDSFSSDKTVEIAKQFGAEVYQNPFISQAKQFEWAMDNCAVNTDWVFRIDADETIDEEMRENIVKAINCVEPGCNGFILNRKHIFLGKWIKHGGRYPLPMLRIFRRGFGHVEQRWMDEHIVLNSGYSKELSGGFEDNNLNAVSWFIDKHNKYATREMIDIQLTKLGIRTDDAVSESTGASIKFKRFLKSGVYNKLPYFVRPTCYFLFRYFIQLGFLDGARGFAYHFMQGFWYRCLVDLKCLEFEYLCRQATNKEERISILENLTGYRLND